MKRNLRNLGTARKSAARTMRAGFVAMAMGMTGAVLASAPPNPLPKKEAGTASTSAKRSRSNVQIGKASWYGKKFNGRRTASGERFDMNAFTCAHRSLPLGSWVRVTNLVNQKAVFLRVNDRGPVPKNRLLDLSYAAAQKLGIGGVAKVRIEPVRTDDLAMAQAMMAEARLHQMLPQIQSASESLPRTRVLPMLVADFVKP
jgi:rare lipoprotein A